MAGTYALNPALSTRNEAICVGKRLGRELTNGLSNTNMDSTYDSTLFRTLPWRFASPARVNRSRSSRSNSAREHANSLLANPLARESVVEERSDRDARRKSNIECLPADAAGPGDE